MGNKKDVESDPEKWEMRLKGSTLMVGTSFAAEGDLTFDAKKVTFDK